MRKLFIAMLSVVLAGQVSARELLTAEIDAVELAVKNELKDPDSAKFDHLEFIETGDNHVYCGLVNAKNSYGGYTGKQLFSTFLFKNKDGEYKAISLDRHSTTGEPSSQEIVSATCAGVGYPVKIKKYLVKTVNKDRKERGLPPIDKSMIEK